MFETIGPVWDGNEVWLVVAGGATFAAFPAWYATMFSGFYIALLLVLVFLIVRVISFEWRVEEREPALAEGLAVGERGRQLRRLADLGRRLREPPLRRADQLERRLRRRLLGPLQRLHGARGARGRGCSSPSTGRPSSRCARTGDLLERAGRAAAAALGARPRVLGAALPVWTVVVAVDRNDKDVFPPVLPAAIGIAALVARRRLRPSAPRRSGRSR